MKTSTSSGFRFFASGIFLASILLSIVVSTAYAETWGKTYHGPWGEWWTTTTAKNFIVTSDGSYAVVGSSNGYGVLLKLTSDGTITWSKVFGRGFEGNTTEFVGIVETADGGFAIAGQAYVDTANGGLGGWDVYVVRLNSSGTILWERIYGRLQAEGQEHPTYEYGRRIYQNADGSFTVTGIVLFSHIGDDCPYHGYESGLILNISQEGTLQSHYVVAGSYAGGPKNEVYKTGDGGYIVGITHSFESLGYTLNLQRYSATGGLEWSQAYYNLQGETYQWLSEHSIAEVADGYLVATTTNIGRYHLFKVDPTGTILWQKQYKIYGNGNSAYPVQIVETADDGTIIALRSGYSTVDQVILKTDGAGDMEWSNFYDGHYMAIARSAGDGYAVATSDFNFVFARLNGNGFLDKRCAALPTSAGDTTEEAAPTAVVMPGKGPITCNEAVTAGTWASGEPQPSLLTGSVYHQVDACIPKLTVSPSPISFYDTKVGLTSTANVGLSNYNGLGDITLGQLSLTDPTNFAIQADGCSGQTISYVNFAPHATSCALQVVFTPKSKGLKVASLTIPSDDPGGPSSVEVRGTGYLPTYSLTLSVTPSGKGSVTANPPGTVFDEGTVVTLTAEAGAGYHFDHWEGSLTGTANPGQVTMTGGKSVTAVFAINTYTVTPAAGPNGSLTPGSAQTVNHGATTAFTANPSPGYHILSVSGCGGSLSGSTFTTGPITDNCTVTASFEINSYTLTANKVGNGNGTLGAAGLTCTGSACTGTYSHGTAVTITATPDVGSLFNGFAGCDTATPTSCTVIMVSEKTVAASFLVFRTLTVTKTGSGSGTVTSTPPGINCGDDCSEAFGYSAYVTLAAVPAEGSSFTGWSGGGCAGTGSCAVSLYADTTVTASFAAVSVLSVGTFGSGSGTVTSTPAGIACDSGGADCSEAFPKGATVTLTATPDPGSAFAYYTGSCSTASPTCFLTMDTDAGVAAIFVPESTKKATLTVSKTKTNRGDGTITSTDGRITCGSDCKDAYYPGSPVTLKATPLEGSVFSGWSKECPSPDGDTCTLTVEKALTVKAIFIGPYTVKVQKTAKNKGAGTVTSMDGKISCGTDCQEAYLYNTTFTLNAVPDPLSVFSGWSGCTTFADTICTVTVDKAKIVKATFTGPSLLKVTITSKNKGSGTVTSNPPGISCLEDCSEAYQYGTTVTLTASPDSGSNFVSFSGCAIVSGPNCTVTMDKAKTVKATFEKFKTTAGADTVEIFGEEHAPEERSLPLERDEFGGTEED